MNYLTIDDLTPEQLQRKFEKRAQALTVGVVLLKTGFDIVETECLDGMKREHKYRFGHWRNAGNKFLNPIEESLKERTDDYYDQVEIFHRLMNLPKEKYTECLILLDEYMKGNVRMEDVDKNLPNV